MSRLFLPLLLLVALCSASATRAGDGWAQIKAGMTLEKTVATIGAPLIKSSGRGYDLWIYDGGGEVIAAQGTVLGWTVPTAVKTLVVQAPVAVPRAPAIVLPVKAAVAQSELNPPAEKSAVLAKNS